METLGFLDVLLEQGGLGCWHPPGDVPAILPELVFEIGAEPDGGLAVGRGMLAVFFSESAWPHGGDRGEFIQQGLPERMVGIGRLFHGSSKNA